MSTAQIAFSIRLDSNIKKEFDEICQEIGMSSSTAFNIFARAVVKEKKIPFELSVNQENELTKSQLKARKIFWDLRKKAADNNADLTIDDINAEISLARKEALNA